MENINLENSESPKDEIDLWSEKYNVLGKVGMRLKDVLGELYATK